ncbi:MAG TPA: NAD(P)-dependent oxidoreductase [Chloroflexota bacterium]|nr:NAD(P)-dependent oxidoreductase [Chloroflexota bacterium]
MNVLVTGAAGFVGSHLVSALAARGHTVFAVHHDPTRLPRLDRVTPLAWDLAAAPPPDLPSTLDAVFHLAQANVPVPAHAAQMFGVHVAATQHLLGLARDAGARRFVLASTGSVYGAGARPWTEADPTEGPGYYAASKVAAEKLVRALGDVVPFSIFRLFTPYGPRQSNRLVPGLIARVTGGQAVTLAAGTGPTFNPIHVSHVVDVLVQSLDAAGNQLLNLGGDDSLSIRDMAVAIGRVVGRDPLLQPQPGAADRIVGDIAALRRAYRLPERLTSFAAGVRSMLAA